MQWDTVSSLAYTQLGIFFLNIEFFSIEHYNNNNKNSNEREEAEKQIKGFSKAQYKKFETRFDAIGYIILKSPSKNTPLESSLEQENLTNKSPQKTPHANRGFNFDIFLEK